MNSPRDPSVLSRNVAAFAAHGVIIPDATTTTPEIRLEAGRDSVRDYDVLSLRTADDRWVRLHSQHDPDVEADRLIAPAFESSEPGLVIVIGLGLGYVLDAIERRSPRTKVIALEPLPASLLHLLSRRDWTAWLTEGRLRLLVGPDYAGASDAWRDFDAEASTPPTVVPAVLTREWAAGIAKAREIAGQIIFGAKANLDARQRLAGQYLLNTLKNLPVIAREGNVGALFDTFTGVPAIIASAGPSLDRNIADLLEFGDRAILIAVDTALRPLLDAGIEPQLVVAVDPSEQNGIHLVNLPDPGRTSLVAEGSMNPGVFEQFAGRTFIFKVGTHHPWPWLQRLGIDRETLRAWGSVATSAFDLALRMGCDPIIFVGQDLAYTGGQPYCRGTTFENRWANEVSDGEELPDTWARTLARSDAQTVDDIYGDRIVTSSPLLAFRDWIVQQSALLDRRTVINGTGGGILYGAGIRQAELGPVLASLPSLGDLGARVRKAWSLTTLEMPATSKTTGPQLLAAFTLARTGDELATWATFANMTSIALASDLEGVANGHPRSMDGTADRAVARPGAPRRIDSQTAPAVYAPEIARACIALMLDEPVPEWARAAIPMIEPIATRDLQPLLGLLPPSALLRVAGRCETSAAYEHAAAVFAHLADRWKLNKDAGQIRSATLNWVRCLLVGGRLRAAENLIDSEAMLPEEFAVQCMCGIHQLADDPALAIPKIEAMVSAFPNIPGPRLNLAVSLAMYGALHDALGLIDVEAARWPERAVTSEFHRGACLRIHGDHEAALSTLAPTLDGFAYGRAEMIVASVGTGRQEAIERSLQTLNDTFQPPVVFMMVPHSQTTIIDAAVARIDSELAARSYDVDVNRVSPIALRLVTQATNAWKPWWSPS